MFVMKSSPYQLLFTIYCLFVCLLFVCFLAVLCAGALSDPNPDVLAALMSAAQTAIGCHGAGLAGQLMEHCETCLQSAGDTREEDVIRQSIVVLMGTLAKHLDKGNPKVQTC